MWQIVWKLIKRFKHRNTEWIKIHHKYYTSSTSDPSIKNNFCFGSNRITVDTIHSLSKESSSQTRPKCQVWVPPHIRQRTLLRTPSSPTQSTTCRPRKHPTYTASDQYRPPREWSRSQMTRTMHLHRSHLRNAAPSGVWGARSCATGGSSWPTWCQFFFFRCRSFSGRM